MRYDYKALYQKNAAFYQSRPKAKRALIVGNLALTAIFFLAYFAFVVYVLFLPMPVWDAVKIVAIPAFCVVCVAFLRLAIDRPRPYSEAGANIVPILRKKSKDKESFPSRHLACAFVIGTVFLPYLTGAGICLLVLGCVLGYVRFALGLHYPSDLVGGAFLGLLCGLFLLI